MKNKNKGENIMQYEYKERYNKLDGKEIVIKDLFLVKVKRPQQTPQVPFFIMLSPLF